MNSKANDNATTKQFAVAMGKDKRRARNKKKKKYEFFEENVRAASSD